MSAKRKISLTVNGTRHEGIAEPRLTLADFLREELDLTGTHLGCEHGVCGACTILFNGEALRSCLLLAVQADGASLMTVEGLAPQGKDGTTDQSLHPLQEAFRENHALQCGFCTPGFLMTAYAFLQENSNPTEEQVREAIAGNICRCTGYIPIVQAILEAARSQGGD
ncbi:MAG: (2Fe-2S)-binding protein [Dehalococcoidia bacterium]